MQKTTRFTSLVTLLLTVGCTVPAATERAATETVGTTSWQRSGVRAHG